MAFGRRGRGAHRRNVRAKVDATVPWETPERPDAPPTTGPWDLVDVPDDGLLRKDFGSLLVPIVSGVRVEGTFGSDGTLVAVTLTCPTGQMQVDVFAAPRTAGIWVELRKQILGTIASQGGTGQEVRGTFGPEIAARLPVQGGAARPARFVGVDGPRWFLRARVTGPAAADRDKGAVLEDALRQMVVVRGTDPLPVRDPLPLKLPDTPTEQDAGQPSEDGPKPSANGTRPRRR